MQQVQTRPAVHWWQQVPPLQARPARDPQRGPRDHRQGPQVPLSLHRGRV